MNRLKRELPPGRYAENDVIHITGQLRSKIKRKVITGAALTLPSFVPRDRREDSVAEQMAMSGLIRRPSTVAYLFMSILISRDQQALQRGISRKWKRGSGYCNLFWSRNAAICPTVRKGTASASPDRRGMSADRRQKVAPSYAITSRVHRVVVRGGQGNSVLTLNVESFGLM